MRSMRVRGPHVALMVACLALPLVVHAAETTDPIARSKTLLILKLATAKTLPVTTEYHAESFTVTIRFPRRRVVGWLPERSTVAQGVVQSITAQYEPSHDPQASRFLETLRIRLVSAYPYAVRSEPGRILIEIDHPASIQSTALEFGLRGGVVLGGSVRTRASDRFRAMQEALTRATTRTHPKTLEDAVASLSASAAQAAQRVAPWPDGTPAAKSAHGGQGNPVVGHESSGGEFASAHARLSSGIAWAAFGVSLVLVGAAGFWLLSQGEPWGARARRKVAGQQPSGLQFVDQLIWRAFERQGYQLVVEMQLMPPLPGTLRVVMKDGAKTALLFIGSGAFLEKQTVERFVRIMEQVNVLSGVLVTSGAFTVPAQRFAKERHVTLIGREQLGELLSVGASSELTLKQIEQQQLRVEELKITVQQYASELDTLRRQRNEASWHLGEERAKSASVETQLHELTEQLHRYAADAHQWQEQAASLRKQWEESQWYLGESRAHAQHFETQLGVVQEQASQLEAMRRERDEAAWYLGEERSKHDALDRQFVELQKHLEESARRERALRETIEELSQELGALRTLGERRRHFRLRAPHARIELWNGGEQPLFSGAPRDLSAIGLGLETDGQLPEASTFRVALHLPDQEPIASTARVIWQRSVDGGSTKYHSGYRLTELPLGARTRINRFIKEFAGSKR